MKTDKKLL